MTHLMTAVRRLVPAMAVALVLTGCTADATDKGGGSGGVTTLRLASPESRARPSGIDVQYLAEQVRSLSDGRMRIEVTWDVGKDEPSWDQEMAQLVIDGDHDLGLVPARAWDVLGVASLQALQAPFLVTSDAALDAIVTDPVADKMMSGLEEVGVSGLVLVPEGLRHPVGFGAPLREPADFAGTVIRTPRSDVTWEARRALGADPQEVSGEAESALFDSGDLGGAESSAAYMPTLPRPGIMTANLTPYAKANVLVANSDVLDGLGVEQRDVLERAAQATLENSVRTRASDAEELATVCSSGLQVVLATAEQQAAMTAATQPVRERLEDDGETGPILARIAEIVDETGPPAAVEACGGVVAGSPAGSEEPLDLAALDGVWRWEVTYQEGLDAGLPDEVAAADLGVQTVRMDSGTYQWDWRSRDGEKSCQGTYRDEGGALVFKDRPAPFCGGFWDARPLLSAGELTWTDVRSRRTVGDPVDQTLRETLHSTPWRKVEDLPMAAAFPEGTYRWEVTEQDLVAAGVDEGEAYFNSGLMTMTVADGRWLHQTASDADQPNCGGSYQVTGARITFTADDGPECGGAAGVLLFSGAWAPTDDGIQFSAIEPANPFMQGLFGQPWRRIG